MNDLQNFCSNCGEKITLGNNFCTKCGMRITLENKIIENKERSIKKETFQTVKPKKKISTKKAIVIGIGVFFAFMIIVGQILIYLDIGHPTSQPSNGSDKGNGIVQNNNLGTTGLVTKPLEDVIPNRQDIGTEWQMGNFHDGDNQFSSSTYEYQTGLGMMVSLDNWQDEQRVKDTTGYQSALQKIYTKHRDSGGITKVWVNLYKFDSVDNANKYYQNFTTYLTNKGGFKEYQTGDINAQCYGTNKETELSSTISIYCVRSNLNYHVIGSSDQDLFDDDKQEISKFAQIITNNVG